MASETGHYHARAGVKLRTTRCRWFFQPREFEIGGAQIHFTGDDFQALESRRFDFPAGCPRRAKPDTLHFAPEIFRRLRRWWRWLCRIQVKEQHALAGGGEAGGEVDGGGVVFPTPPF